MKGSHVSANVTLDPPATEQPNPAPPATLWPQHRPDETASSIADKTSCLIRRPEAPLPTPESVSPAAPAATASDLPTPPPFEAELIRPPAPAAPQTADPWIGRTIKDYVIEEFIGAGGMGRVYRARHRWLDMHVAIKFLKEDLNGDEMLIARFRREALAVARLNHPNIVRATDGGMIGDTLFLVTEFVPGASLTAIQRNRILTIPQICEIICQAAAALQHAHENGMVHRDIKPSNLMLSTSGQVKLLDLGIARFVQGQTTLTETGHVMGTLDYMAPEQAGDSRNVDIRADIYSLGCTMYYLLTGVPPFYGPQFDTPLSKIVAHSDTEPPAVTLRRKNVPRGVLICLSKMMAKDREDRYRTPAAVIAALKPYTANANLASLLQPETGVAPQPAVDCFAEPQADWIDFLYDNLMVVFKALLCLVGILERKTVPVSPLTNSRTKTVYEVSLKGVANTIIFATVAAFLYFSGFRIYFW
jgi:serine/threonine protein kinase